LNGLGSELAKRNSGQIDFFSGREAASLAYGPGFFLVSLRFPFTGK